MILASNRTLLITGCNRGIGKAILTKFTENRYNVIACNRTISDDFRAFCNELMQKYSVQISLYQCDLSDSNSIADTMKAIFQSKVQIDVLVNNAGMAFGAFFSMTSVNKIRELFEVNFFAPVLISQYVSKWMQKRGRGVIINLGSVAGLDPMEGFTAYGTSKASLMMFTKILAKELGKYNIRVNAVAPGLTETEMALEMEKKSEEYMVNMTSFKRLGKPYEIANLVYYLASDEAEFITGQVIRIDGGM